MATHLVISGNPSKYLQGHNIFGSDDLISLMLETYLKITKEHDLSPTDLEIYKVKTGSYTLSRIDINYGFKLPTPGDVRSFLRAIEFKAATRHGKVQNTKGTIYFGKDSKRWKIKFYAKGEEIKVKGHKLPNDLSDTPLFDYAQNLLRIELTLCCKQLIESELNYAKSWGNEMPRKKFKEYLNKIDINENILLTSPEMMNIPKHLLATYALWQEGHNVRELSSRNTFFRHKRELKKLGINISSIPDKTLQNNVIPLIKVLETKEAQIPSWAFEQNLVHKSAQKNQPKDSYYAR